MNLPNPPPHQIVEVFDATLGRLGYVVIDQPVHGVAAGGVRFSPTVSPAELADIARGMTLKWAFLNVPLGGAKAGIFADPRQLGCDRTTLMEAFGRAIAPLVQQHVYYPGVDMGTTLEDLAAIMRGAGRPLVGEQIDASWCTGLTVFEAVRQMARFAGQDLAGLRVALEGFGKVGSALARLLAQAGARLVAVSTAEGAIVAEDGLDLSRLLALHQQHGDRLVQSYPGATRFPREALYTLPVDLLVPGAQTHVLTTDNADHVRAKWIVPIANAPATAEAEAQLAARGVVIMPDFVANCGGVLAAEMRGAGFDAEEVRRVVESAYASLVWDLLQSARREARPVTEIARQLAWQNHLALNAPEPASAGLWDRAARLWKKEGGRGVWRRLAWRAHRRSPRLPYVVRRLAVERYVEMTLGVTSERLAHLFPTSPDAHSSSVAPLAAAPGVGR
jgi:glutamate dehydrogenase (NAD(P)+)